MIGTIYIKCNAAHPNLALPSMFTFINSPQSVRVIDVPKKIGSWNITDVFVNVNYPDNSLHSEKCVKVGCAYVATIDAPTSTGKSINGYSITANGVDENGEEVSGYVLGKGDVHVMDGDGEITIGETTFYLHMLDEMPDEPKKGDVFQDDNALKIYDGEKWIACPTDFDPSNYYTKAEIDTLADNYKTKQTAKSSPSASGNTTSFIDTISQNANGEITATKKTVPTASTSRAGIVALNNSLSSNSTTQAATANTVKTLNDKFADYLPLSGGTLLGSLKITDPNISGESQGNIGIQTTILPQNNYIELAIRGNIDNNPWLEIGQYNDRMEYRYADFMPTGVLITDFDHADIELQWPSYSTLAEHANVGTIATEEFVADNYLPLSGGELTGTLTAKIDSDNINITNAYNEARMYELAKSMRIWFNWEEYENGAWVTKQGVVSKQSATYWKYDIGEVTIVDMLDGDVYVDCVIRVIGDTGFSIHADIGYYTNNTDSSWYWNDQPTFMTSRYPNSYRNITFRVEKITTPSWLQPQANVYVACTTTEIKDLISYSFGEEISVDYDSINVLDRDIKPVQALTLYQNRLNVIAPEQKNGRARDFCLKIVNQPNQSAGEVRLYRTDANITVYTPDGNLPKIAEGGTSGSLTMVYFTEIAPNVFMAKSEVLKQVV